MNNPSLLLTCTVLSFLAIGVSAEEKIGKPLQPISATIVHCAVYNEQKIAYTTAINILEPEIIKKLEAYFPDYNKAPTSNKAGGWKEGYMVYFNFGDGKTISVEVAINDNGGIWTMGHGDLVTNGNFAKFVQDLEDRESPKKK